MVKGGPFSLTRAEMESGRDERHPAVFSLPSRPRIFNGGNIYPAKGWRLVPIVFKLLRGGKIISPFFFFFVQSTDIHFVVVAQLLSRV